MLQALFFSCKMLISGFLGHAKFGQMHFCLYLVIFYPKTIKKTKKLLGAHQVSARRVPMTLAKANRSEGLTSTFIDFCRFVSTLMKHNTSLYSYIRQLTWNSSGVVQNIFRNRFGPRSHPRGTFLGPKSGFLFVGNLNVQCSSKAKRLRQHFGDTPFKKCSYGRTVQTI